MNYPTNVRLVIKHSFLKSNPTAHSRARAHVNYIAFRPGKDKEEKDRTFFNGDSAGIAPAELRDTISTIKTRGVLFHKLIISPCEDVSDLQAFTKDLMENLGRQKGLDLTYWGIVHRNTKHPHVHVVLLAKDKNGRMVRLNRSDYKFLRESGEKLLGKNQEKSIPKRERSIFAPIGRMLANLGFRPKPVSPEANKAVPTEKDLFGEQNSSAQKLRQIQKEAKRQQRETELKNLILTIHRNSVPSEYSSSSPLTDLQQLAQEYDDGFLRDQLTKTERRLLTVWINNWERWQTQTGRLDKQSNWKSHQIKSFEVECEGQNKMLFSFDSDLKELKRLKTEVLAGKVVLSSAEEKALNRWIKLHERELPIQIDLKNGSKTFCSPKDELKSLEQFARSNREYLSEQENRRLWYWIFNKRFLRDMNKSIELNSPYGKLSYSRSDKLDDLRVLATKYRDGETWLTQQMNRNEYDRLCKWIKEQETRFPDLPR